MGQVARLPVVTPVLTSQIVEIEDRDGPLAAYAALRRRLDPYREEGTTVPPELVRLEQRLVAECCAMSQGR
jgi:hypothetical protein